MKDFNELINRSYKAIKGMGLITSETAKVDFLEKIKEETKESYQEILHEADYVEEITDIATVCIMQIKHLGYDFVEEFEKVIEKNEARAKLKT